MALGYTQHKLQAPQDVETAVNFLNKNPFVAVDTEFVRRSTYYPQFALLQMASSTESFVLDPTRFSNLDSLKALFSNQNSVKVIHSSRQDIEIFIHHFNLIPFPIADTQILAEFCGFEENISLQELCYSFFGIHLSKEFQCLNWIKRPLPKKAIAYALEDVEYTYHCYLFLKSLAENKYTWFQEEMVSLSDPKFYEETPEKLISKFKKSTSSLKRKQKKNLAAILLIRQRIAAFTNLLVKNVLSDQVCYELCCFTASEIKVRLEADLSKNLGTLFRQQRQKNIRHQELSFNLHDIIEEGFFIVENFDPEVEVYSFKRTIFDAFQASVQHIAKAHEINQTLLARSKDIKAHITGKPSRVTKGWRYKLLKSVL